MVMVSTLAAAEAEVELVGMGTIPLVIHQLRVAHIEPQKHPDFGGFSTILSLRSSHLPPVLGTGARLRTVSFPCFEIAF
jgi:hypothetical protein